MNIVKWFKKKFKAVYCNECEHRSEEVVWYGQHDCYASPFTYILEKGSLSERPTKEAVPSHHFAEKVKIFPWCSKYKKLTEEVIQARKEEKRNKLKKKWEHEKFVRSMKRKRERQNDR